MPSTNDSDLNKGPKGKTRIDRRDFLRKSSIVTAGLGLTACYPQGNAGTITPRPASPQPEETPSSSATSVEETPTATVVEPTKTPEPTAIPGMEMYTPDGMMSVRVVDSRVEGVVNGEGVFVPIKSLAAEFATEGGKVDPELDQKYGIIGDEKSGFAMVERAIEEGATNVDEIWVKRPGEQRWSLASFNLKERVKPFSLYGEPIPTASPDSLLPGDSDLGERTAVYALSNLADEHLNENVGSNQIYTRNGDFKTGYENDIEAMQRIFDLGGQVMPWGHYGVFGDKLLMFRMVQPIYACIGKGYAVLPIVVSKELNRQCGLSDDRYNLDFLLTQKKGIARFAIASVSIKDGNADGFPSRKYDNPLDRVVNYLYSNTGYNEVLLERMKELMKIKMGEENLAQNVRAMDMVFSGYFGGSVFESRFDTGTQILEEWIDDANNILSNLRDSDVLNFLRDVVKTYPAVALVMQANSR